jgi:hypothetical protein
MKAVYIYIYTERERERERERTCCCSADDEDIPWQLLSLLAIWYKSIQAFQVDNPNANPSKWGDRKSKAQKGL